MERVFFYAQQVAIDLVIFDIAGTIIHDRGEVSLAFVEAMRQHGFRVTENEVLEWKGAGKRAVIRHLLRQAGRPDEPATVEAIHGSFVAALHNIYESGALQPIEGAEDTFRALHARGFKLGVTTGFGRSTMELILERLGWVDNFCAKVSTEDVPHGRPEPDMIFEVMRRSRVPSVGSIANLGDTPLDLRSAYAAGVALNVGVLTGMHTRERLAREPHTHLIASVADFPGLLRVSD